MSERVGGNVDRPLSVHYVPMCTVNSPSNNLEVFSQNDKLFFLSVVITVQTGRRMKLVPVLRILTL